MVKITDQNTINLGVNDKSDESITHDYQSQKRYIIMRNHDRGGKVSATMHHVRNVRVIVNHDALDTANNDFSCCRAVR